MLITALIAGGVAVTGVKVVQILNRRRRESRSFVEQGGETDPSASELPVVSTPMGGLAADRRLSRDALVASLNVGVATLGKLLVPLLLSLSTCVALLLYVPIFLSAYRNLIKDRRVGFSVLDAGFMVLLVVGGFWWLVAFAAWFITVAKFLVTKTADRSRKSLANLFYEQPRTVWVLVDSAELEIPFEHLTVADIIVLHAGQTVPVDGEVVDGAASVDQRLLTGEAQPVEKAVGDTVYTSTLVLSGHIQVQVRSTGHNTVAAQIGEILMQTADYRLDVQRKNEAWLDQIAPFAAALGCVSIPLVGLSGTLALLANLPTFKLRFYAPLATLNYLRLAAQQGILIKDGRALELLNDIDIVIFDKTGMLTTDDPEVAALHPCDGITGDELLRYAAAAEYRQTHPIAKAILLAADERQLSYPRLEASIYKAGYGIEVEVDNRVIQVGSDRYMASAGIGLSAEFQALQAACHHNGHAVVMIALDGQLAGAIELHPTVRPEAQWVMRQLHNANLFTAIISGDQEAPTRQLATELGIAQYFANTLPEDKAALVAQFQAEGKTVCYVGDGINDSIALKQADVSISLSGASTLALDTSQIVLMNPELTRLLQAFQMASELDTNVERSRIVNTWSSAVCATGVLMLGLGVMGGMAISVVTEAVILGNTMQPVLARRG